MITWIVHIGFKCFWLEYHLGQHLGWDWRWASHLIRYAHGGWSCDLDIFGIPEVNFPPWAIKLYIWRDLMGIHDINPGCCCVYMFVFSPNFYNAFLNEPRCLVMIARCPDNNLICLHWTSFFVRNMYHLDQDLGWDWIWASDLIEYAHNGWSCDFGIFGIPKINFPARAFKLDI